MEPLIAFTTFPDPAQARQVATILVEEHLAACCTVIPGATSVFRWQGAVDSAEEAFVIIKTSTTAFQALTRRLKQLHPYKVPELVATPLTHGLPEYFDWMRLALDENGE